jgi:hypothetical protein
MKEQATMNGESWGIADANALLRAIELELELAQAEAQELAKKGRQTQREADYVIALLQDVRADLTFAFTAPLAATRTDPAQGWHNKVRWLRREHSDRRETYPELVRKGRMSESQARERLRTIRALVKLYWQGMFMWTPEPGPVFDWYRQLRISTDPAELAELRTRPEYRQWQEAARLQAELSAPAAEQGSLLAA